MVGAALTLRHLPPGPPDLALCPFSLSTTTICFPWWYNSVPPTTQHFPPVNTHVWAAVFPSRGNVVMKYGAGAAGALGSSDSFLGVLTSSAVLNSASRHCPSGRRVLFRPPVRASPDWLQAQTAVRERVFPASGPEAQTSEFNAAHTTARIGNS